MTTTNLNSATPPHRLAQPVRLIEQNWPEGSMPLVSVVCPTYNHEKFISQCLDGFLTQETTFPIEIIVHDDASTDRTAVIVGEYVSRYPDLFRAILQTENQRSQGRRVLRSILPLARGKYIATCEGDDYWIDARKLEKQVAILEGDKECVGVFHWARIRDEATGKILDGWGPQWGTASQPHKVRALADRYDASKFTLDDLLEYGNFIPTCSVLARPNARLQSFDLGPSFGDFALHVSNTLQGPYAFIDEPMAVYRFHPQGSFSRLSELDKLTASLQSIQHLATVLGLRRRPAFARGIASRYECIRAFHAAAGNLMETLRTTTKMVPYVSYRQFPRMMMVECRFLASWLIRRFRKRTLSIRRRAWNHHGQ